MLLDEHRPARPPAAPRAGRGTSTPIPDAALAWEGGRDPCGSARRELPARVSGADARDAGGRLVVPGLVDCHTHLAFGGWRADEFEQRIAGRELPRHRRARAAGSRAPCALTREAGADALAARARAASSREMLALGVTTVECKSGYGLDREHELRAAAGVPRGSRSAEPIARRADVSRRARGAAGVPRSPRGVRRAAHRRADPGGRARAARPVLRRVRGGVGLHRGGGAPDPARGPRRRAGARSSTPISSAPAGGAELAAEVGALSADHLEHVSPTRASRRMAPSRGGGGEPADRHALPGPAADAGAPA